MSAHTGDFVVRAHYNPQSGCWRWVIYRQGAVFRKSEPRYLDDLEALYAGRSALTKRINPEN
jgi:hypothetical protein